MQINVKDKATCFQYYNSSSYSFNNDSEAVLSYITFNYINEYGACQAMDKKDQPCCKKRILKGFYCYPVLSVW